MKASIDKYIESRNKKLKDNSYPSFENMSDEEMQANQYLNEIKNEYLKSQQFNNAYELDFIYDKNIKNSKLYNFVKNIPKGADLHVHDMAVLPIDEFVDFCKGRKDVFVRVNKDTERCKIIGDLHFTENPDEYIFLDEAIHKGILTKDILKQELCLSNSLKRKQKYDSWVKLQKNFSSIMLNFQDNKFNHDYHKYLFEYYYKNNIKHIELKISFFGEKEDALESARTIRDAYYEFKKEHEDFSVKLIGCSLKYKFIDEYIVDKLIESTLYVYENLEDDYDKENISKFLVGFDFINEEDKSFSLYELKDKIFKIKKKCPDLNLYLHAGESMDVNNNNVLDAHLLGCNRIGHAFNLYKFPNLMHDIKNSNSCIEVCPVSNNVLGYCKDLRQHPAVEYLKRNIPIVLSSDDPAFFENASLTDDFFAAIISWDLEIDQIKKLILNSIEYSSLDLKNKYLAKDIFERDFNDFINKIIF